MESMADFAKELEASFRKLNVDDIVEGTIVSVDGDKAYADINYYAQGVITRANYSADPSFSMLSIKIGDPITAVVLADDDREGNVSLSVKEAVRAQAWEAAVKYCEEGTVLNLKVGGIVNKGVIVYVEGLRGFIPVSQLSLDYVDDTNPWLGKTIEAKVITADEEKDRLVLSAKEVLLDRRREEKERKVNAITAGMVLEGTVETLQPYGAFINLGNGLSGLVHISQLANKRVNSPGEVVKIGQPVKVKVLKVEDGKISLSMKALEELTPVVEIEEPEITYKDEGSASTGLGALLAGLKL